MRRPWMKFYIDDWGGGVKYFDTLTRGAYLNMLIYQWEKGAIPNEKAKLMQITGLTARQLKRCWPDLETKFQERDGMLTNFRLSKERNAVLESSQKRSESQKKRRVEEQTGDKLVTKLSQTEHIAGSGSGSGSYPPVSEGNETVAPPAQEAPGARNTRAFADTVPSWDCPCGQKENTTRVCMTCNWLFDPILIDVVAIWPEAGLLSPRTLLSHWNAAAAQVGSEHLGERARRFIELCGGVRGGGSSVKSLGKWLSEGCYSEPDAAWMPQKAESPKTKSTKAAVDRARKRRKAKAQQQQPAGFLAEPQLENQEPPF